MKKEVTYKFSTLNSGKLEVKNLKGRYNIEGIGLLVEENGKSAMTAIPYREAKLLIDALIELLENPKN